MAAVKIEKQKNSEQQGTPQNPQNQLSTTGRPDWKQSGGLARRDTWTPSIFSLSPRDFFNSNPFELMRRFSEEMDRAFENFGLARGKNDYGAGRSSLWSPAVEVFERDNNLVVRAELPGLNKEDVQLEMTDDRLVIQGERKREHEEQGEGWYRSERSYGQFYRVIPLPEGASADQTEAQFENGVLEVSIPVPESQNRRRTIPIGETKSAAHQPGTTQQTGHKQNASIAGANR